MRKLKIFFLVLLVFLVTFEIFILFSLNNDESTQESLDFTESDEKVLDLDNPLYDDIRNTDGMEKVELVFKHAPRVNRIDVSSCELEPPIVKTDGKSDIVFVNNDENQEITLDVSSGGGGYQTYFVAPDSQISLRTNLLGEGWSMRSFGCFIFKTRPGPGEGNPENEVSRGYILMTS